MASTIPVILSGGAGTRLWPLSRLKAPKQLQRLLGPDTMLESTISRIDHLDGPVVVVAGVDSLDQIGAAIPGTRRSRLIGEPIGRNTAPAVTAAALTVASDDVLLVLPADHHIADAAAFRVAVDRAVEVASSIVSEPSNRCSCLGALTRDTGHRRVPVPPDRMTGIVVAMDN